VRDAGVLGIGTEREYVNSVGLASPTHTVPSGAVSPSNVSVTSTQLSLIFVGSAGNANGSLKLALVLGSL